MLEFRREGNSRGNGREVMKAGETESNIMVTLSQLRRFDLTDDQGQRARLMDLAVALLDADYPPVTRLFFLNSANQKRSLAWDQVRDVDLKARRMCVRDLKEAQREFTNSMAKEVLLGDDVLDAMVLDLQNRRATRANDLWLEEEKDQLLLRARWNPWLTPQRPRYSVLVFWELPFWLAPCCRWLPQRHSLEHQRGAHEKP